MRVLLLTRQEWGGMRTWAQTLERVLPQGGVQARHVDASAWMPAATGEPHDRRVTRDLRSLAADHDLVHAFGYRCAWACAEAFGGSEFCAMALTCTPRLASSSAAVSPPRPAPTTMTGYGCKPRLDFAPFRALESSGGVR